MPMHTLAAAASRRGQVGKLVAVGGTVLAGTFSCEVVLQFSLKRAASFPLRGVVNMPPHSWAFCVAIKVKLSTRAVLALSLRSLAVLAAPKPIQCRRRREFDRQRRGRHHRVASPRSP
jgi:hypothetical protein